MTIAHHRSIGFALWFAAGCVAGNPNFSSAGDAGSSDTPAEVDGSDPENPNNPGLNNPGNPNNPGAQAVPGPLAAFAMLPSSLPKAPTNHVADDVNARALGRQLFFDTRLSEDATVACVSCHDPAHGLADDKALSVGVGGHLGARHALPINDAVFHPFLFWDGRVDSAWAQPLQAIENDKEMAFSRTEVAHFIAASYRAEYEQLFGALPALDDLPVRAKPGLPAWDALTDEQKDVVQRIFANVGKTLEAYERQIICADTRFDRWVAGSVSFTNDEFQGARTFVARGCVGCHAGPTFSDGQFHNIGLGSGTNQPDTGRSGATAQLLADPFNGAGVYSDDRTAGQHKLDGVSQERGTLAAFRTPTLRGVGQRSFFGQRPAQHTLLDFITTVYHRPHLEPGAVGTLDPKLANVAGGGEPQLVAFLRTLDCPSLPASLLAP